MRKIIIGLLLLLSFGASAQWQQTGSKVRYVNGLGIPTKDTAAGVAADSSQIVIRPADSALYIKYKRTWLRVGGGGGSIAGGGTAGQVSFFTGASAISGDSALFWDNTNKRLGIHTKNPGRNLDVHGANVIAQFNGTGTNNAYLDFQNAGSTKWRIGNQYAAAVNRFSIFNAAGASEVFTILQDGKVGINTPNPTSGFTFDVTGNIPAIFNSNSTSTSSNFGSLQSFRQTNVAGAGNGIAFGLRNDFNNNAEYGYIGAIIENNLTGGQSGSLSFLPVFSGVRSEAIRITSGGRVNIGGSFTSTNNTLQVTGNAAIGYTTAAPANGLLVNGNVGIGTASPLSLYRLTLNGDASTILGGITLRQNGTDVMYIGNIVPSNTTDFEFWNPRNGYTRFATNNLERLQITAAGRILMGVTLPADNGVDELQVNGSISGIGFKQAYVLKTSAYTATDDDYVIDCTLGTYTVNLFTAVGNTGRILIIKNSGVGTITVDGNASETIDGAATYAISVQYGTIQIMSDGTNWKIIAKF